MPLNQGMNFDIENTTWWKPDGSDHFKVRSVLFDGAGMTIQTYDGRMINGDILSNYIQSEVPINPPKDPPVQKINRALLMQGISEEELGDVFNTPGIGASLNSKPTPAVSQESANDIIIKRMMDNLGYPNVEFEVRIDITPEYVEKLKTSAQVMGVDMKDIKTYICNNIKDEDIRSKLNAGIADIFDVHFGLPGTEPEKTPPEEIPPAPSPEWFEDDSFNI